MLDRDICGFGIEPAELVSELYDGRMAGQPLVLRACGRDPIEELLLDRKMILTWNGSDAAGKAAGVGERAREAAGRDRSDAAWNRIPYLGIQRVVHGLEPMSFELV